MKNLRVPFALNFSILQHTGRAAVLAATLALAACGGGGGAGVPEPPEAVVTSVQAESTALEGSAGGTSDLSFQVSLDKPVIGRVELRVSTVSAIKPGFASTPGAAKGGASCTEGVDYIVLQDQAVLIAAGQNSATITVKVCHDTDFEPNEVFYLTWKPVGGVDSRVQGVIINDDVGGLNGTGATALLGGLPAFGRDVLDKTRSDADGALGFSFDAQASAPCIQDKVTGLLWQKDWTASSHMTMATLVNNANAGAGLCGRTDWRVPTSNELLSLIHYGVPAGQAVNADALFSSAMTGDFWTSQEVASATDNAWGVSPGQGGAVTFFSKSAATPWVRLVSGTSRADTCNDAADRFTVWKDASTPAVPDGTVYDKRSGLMWKQCTEGDVGAQCNQTSSPSFNTATATPTSLANWVKSVNANPNTLGAGYSDWRIPTVKELASLVDRCVTSAPAINTTFFPASKPMSYITSTVNAYGSDVNTFWYVDFKDGTVAVGSPSNKYLRLVRGGQ